MGVENALVGHPDVDPCTYALTHTPGSGAIWADQLLDWSVPVHASQLLK